LEKRVHGTFPVLRCYSLANNAKGILGFIMLNYYDLSNSLKKPTTIENTP
jgi:hypothetical protein